VPDTDQPEKPTPDAAPPPLGYEEAREELLDVVRRLEAGSATLEESLALWERGEALAAICQRWLDGARERLTAAAGAAPEPDAAES
jgi:exodeoxyribonuclease VII small subunit